MVNITAHVLMTVFAMFVALGHVSVLLVYFFGVVRAKKTDFVSDILSRDRLYMNLNTFFVLLQLSACFALVRFHAPFSTAGRVAVESMFLSVSWVGWCVLNLKYNSGGEVSRMHFLGVGLFVSGGIVYFAFLMWELYMANRRERVSGLLVLLYFMSVVFGGLFILGYFAGWTIAWVFEHSAFIVFSMAHSYLFWLDLCGDEDEEEEFTGSSFLNNVRLCRERY
jgi:hypothetical protein